MTIEAAIKLTLVTVFVTSAIVVSYAIRWPRWQVVLAGLVAIVAGMIGCLAVKGPR